jgi:hypothetical protein
MVDSLVTAGSWIEEISEPKLTDEQKEELAEKQAWLARYVGVMFRARPVPNLQ